jgi:hypothetical protein
MEMRAAAAKQYYTVPKASGLDLNARKNVVFFDNEIVPVILTEWNRHQIAGAHQIAHHAKFRNVADALGIALHTRFHSAIVGNACATSTSW